MNLAHKIDSLLSMDVTKLSIPDLCGLSIASVIAAEAIRELLLNRGENGAIGIAVTCATLYAEAGIQNNLKGNDRKAAEKGNRGLSYYANCNREARKLNSAWTVSRKGAEFVAAKRQETRARVVNKKEKSAKIPSAAETFAKAFRTHAGLAANADLPTMLAMLATMPRGTVKTGKRASTARKVA